MFRLRLIFFLLTFTITSYGRILPKDGHLTVHKDLQKLATKLLEGKQGSIVAIEPATGEVLCMVSASHDNDDVNHAIETNYSPVLLSRWPIRWLLCRKASSTTTRSTPVRRDFGAKRFILAAINTAHRRHLQAH